MLLENNNEKEKDFVEPKVEETEVIEVVEEDEDDDNEFLKSLEKYNEKTEVEEEEDDDEDDEDEEERLKEEQRLKNKNAEEARKRREAEAKAKEEAEAKAKEEKLKAEAEAKAKEETKVVDNYPTPSQQVDDLVKKYPEIDLKELDENEDFQEYLEGKWKKGGKTITEIYESFINFTSRLTKVEKEEVERRYKKKGTPNIKSKSTTNGFDSNLEIFSKEELDRISSRMPFMSAKEFEKIEEKYERSIKHHKKNER